MTNQSPPWMNIELYSCSHIPLPCSMVIGQYPGQGLVSRILLSTPVLSLSPDMWSVIPLLMVTRWTLSLLGPSNVLLSKTLFHTDAIQL